MAPRSIRAQRSKIAVDEVSSLAKPSRGIDARSLAAKPPLKFTITRTLGDFPDRKPARGGANITRGQRGGRGARGRGGGGSRGRRPRGRGSQRREPSEEEQEEAEDELDEEELNQLDMVYGGFPTAYEPTTKPETLGTPVLTSAKGLVESVKYKMQVATSNTNGVNKQGGEHLARMGWGDGTFFESPEAKEFTELFNNQVRKDKADKFGHEFQPERIRTLPEKEREVLAKAWAAGHYELPEVAGPDDVIGHVQTYTRRNETYLAEDGRKLEEKLRSLLPAQYLKSESGKPLPKRP